MKNETSSEKDSRVSNYVQCVSPPKRFRIPWAALRYDLPSSMVDKNGFFSSAEATPDGTRRLPESGESRPTVLTADGSSECLTLPREMPPPSLRFSWEYVAMTNTNVRSYQEG